MFSGFNVALTKDFFNNRAKEYNDYVNIGIKHLNIQTENLKNNLNQYISNNIIDGKTIEEEWFPNIAADIFISHSHGDNDLANAFAGWLSEEFGLKVFIDSNVWCYSQNLLDAINDKYNKVNESFVGCYYNYHSCCLSSQHVNLMLNMALQKMIDKVECVMLLNTNNSVNAFYSNQGKLNTTYSPWICSEILCTQIVRRKPLLCYRNKPINAHIYENNMYTLSLMISYDLSLQHLIDINQNDLLIWYKKYHNNNPDKYESALDYLYQDKCSKLYEYSNQLMSVLGENKLQLIKEYFDGIAKSENDLQNIQYNYPFFDCRCCICPCDCNCEMKYRCKKLSTNRLE